jgi:hypothetical protein
VCLASSRDAAHDRKICGHSRKALLLELFKEIRKNRRLQKLAAEYEDLLKGTCIDVTRSRANSCVDVLMPEKIAFVLMPASARTRACARGRARMSVLG